MGGRDSLPELTRLLEASALRLRGHAGFGPVASGWHACHLAGRAGGPGEVDHDVACEVARRLADSLERRPVLPDSLVGRCVLAGELSARAALASLIGDDAWVRGLVFLARGHLARVDVLLSDVDEHEAVRS